MIRIIIIVFSLLISKHTFSATILIVTDEPGQKKAQEVRELISKTQPFSTSSVEIKIQSVPINAISCKPYEASMSSNEILSLEKELKKIGSSLTTECKSLLTKKIVIDRCLDCDEEKLGILAAKNNADYTIFIKNSDQEGGCSGNFVAMTTRESPNTGLHELLHLFNFADEYEYPECEAPLYCAYMQQSPNIAIFNDIPPYSSDSQARSQHKNQIPWYGQIKPATLITTGSQLGTPKNGVTGLFISNVCDQMRPVIKTWKPGNEITIMQSLETNYIPEAYWPEILSGLGVKAAPTGAQPNSKSKPPLGSH